MDFSCNFKHRQFAAGEVKSSELKHLFQGAGCQQAHSLAQGQSLQWRWLCPCPSSLGGVPQVIRGVSWSCMVSLSYLLTFWGRSFPLVLSLAETSSVASSAAWSTSDGPFNLGSTIRGGLEEPGQQAHVRSQISVLKIQTSHFACPFPVFWVVFLDLQRLLPAGKAYIVFKNILNILIKKYLLTL